MTVVLITSSEPRAGRSMIAAALAYRHGRDGQPTTLARLAGDGADADAAAFASLEGIITPGRPIDASSVGSLSGDVVLEAPAGSVAALADALDARVIVVATPSSAPVDAPASRVTGTIVTRAPAAERDAIAGRSGTLAVIGEDRILAAPSVADIARTLEAQWLVGDEDGRAAIERVMIGTVASDAATPYFSQRQRTCVITRFDKTDIQLAALQTDLECLVITGGGEPSPYLIDRVRGSRDDVAVLLTGGTTVESMSAIEHLYGQSRFEGQGKLLRAVALLDEAGVTID